MGTIVGIQVKPDDMPVCTYCRQRLNAESCSYENRKIIQKNCEAAIIGR